MNYENFRNDLLLSLQMTLGTDYIVSGERKPDGDILFIFKRSAMQRICLRFQGIYESYTTSLLSLPDMIAIEIITDKIIGDIRNVLLKKDNLTADREIDKSKIFYRLMPVPDDGSFYIKYLDLAIVFYELIDSAGNYMQLLHINEAYLNQHHLTPNNLLSLAHQNTQELFPYTFNKLEKYILNKLDDCEANEEFFDAVKKSETDAPTLDAYILSNEQGNAGTSCILYPDVLKSISDKLGDDLLIMLPCIHEALIFPLKQYIPSKMEDFHKLADNFYESAVSENERLSRKLLIYKHSDNSVQIVEQGGFYD